MGDVIARGAFIRTLRDLNNRIKLFWNHDLSVPIGFGTATETAEGLMVRGALNLQVGRAKEIHALMKQASAAGSPFGLSFGFDAVKADPVYGKPGVKRILREVRLHEISLTLMPAQRLATVASVKALTTSAVDASNASSPSDALTLAVWAVSRISAGTVRARG